MGSYYCYFLSISNGGRNLLPQYRVRMVLLGSQARTSQIRLVYMIPSSDIPSSKLSS